MEQTTDTRLLGFNQHLWAHLTHPYALHGQINDFDAFADCY